MTSEEIVDKIKEWCFSQESSTYDDHNRFQEQLVNFLRENDWDAYKEYELENYSKLSEKTEKIKDQIGFIDIVAFGHNKKILIEYDNTNILKFKSICKLLYSEANFLIGIVHGKRGKPFLIFENSVKIKKTAKEIDVTDKSIFVLVIENKIAEWVHV
ncbi:hypothetical protein MUO66_00715 [Candidatus Bathyarchaeota archaeon]|nr:hypothetical protein [Candidatus Bathyarchaeota archaeon]